MTSCIFARARGHELDLACRMSTSGSVVGAGLGRRGEDEEEQEATNSTRLLL